MSTPHLIVFQLSTRLTARQPPSFIFRADTCWRFCHLYGGECDVGSRISFYTGPSVIGGSENIAYNTVNPLSAMVRVCACSMLGR